MLPPNGAFAYRVGGLKNLQRSMLTRIDVEKQYAWGGTNVRILDNMVHDCYETGIVSGHSSAGVSKNDIIQGNHVYNSNLNE